MSTLRFAVDPIERIHRIQPRHSQVVKQLEYTLSQGYFPCVEFNEDSAAETYFWTMWKLPLFNATSPQEVLNEVQQCRSEYPGCYIRIVAFDNIKQCQVMSFIVHKPNSY